MSWVTRTLKYPRSTVRNIVNTFLDTDRIQKLPRGGRHNVKLEVEHLEWLTDKLDEFAGRPVAMLTQELNEHFGFIPPITERAVDKALNKHTAYTLKLSLLHIENVTPLPINAQRKFFGGAIYFNYAQLYMISATPLI
ncbi:hypothetical protein BGZ82_002972 [Podila clonocystis]|nr:hypothetical protein BGZ82_002972 [Podila clonocystis]